MTNLRVSFRAALVTGSLLWATGAAHADNLRYATGFAPGTTGTTTSQAAADYLAEISGGDMTMDVFAQSLLGFGEMNAGIRDGIADAGFVLFPYFPAEYRNMSFIADLNMVMTIEKTGDRGGLAWVGALNEYVMMNCDSCQKEIKAQNQVFTSTSASEYRLLCTKQVTVADDMKGLKIRAPGANWSRWVENFGAIPVSLPFAEMYEGLSQGIIDCSIASDAELVDQSLIDVIKSVTTDVPGGGFGGSSLFSVNLDTWGAMTPEQRKTLARAASYGGAVQSWGYRANAAAARSKAIEAGITFVEADPAFYDATVEWIKADMDAAASTYEEKYGVENPDEAKEIFLKLFKKWAVLVEDIQTSDALADLVWQEVGSKVDYSTYGM